MNEANEELMSKAVKFAMKAHNDPEFINGHITKVVTMVIVATAFNRDIPEDDKAKIIAATYLHDTIEDTDTTFPELVDEFGLEVACLVQEVTKKGDNCFPALQSKYGYLIKYCDRTCNLLHRIKDGNDSALDDPYFKKSVFWKGI